MTGLTETMVPHLSWQSPISTSPTLAGDDSGKAEVDIDVLRAWSLRRTGTWSQKETIEQKLDQTDKVATQVPATQEGANDSDKRASSVALSTRSHITELPVKRFITRLPNPESQRILRTHFLDQVLADLEQIQEYCGTPQAATYACSMLTNMRAMRDFCPTDPFIEVILALHDAMAFENKWSEYDNKQYAIAFDLVRRLSNRPSLSDNTIEKAIASLEAAGFDTMPIPALLDYDEQDG